MAPWRSPFQHVLDGFPPSEAELPQHLTEDERWMLVAIDEARRGIGKTAPNPPVGCVLTNKGRAVGRGYHRAAGRPHAEVEAMRDADEGLIRGATAYVTLEPCNHQGRTPACTSQLISAGVGRVVVGVQDPNPRVNGSGLERLRASGVQVEVMTGIVADLAAALIKPFSRGISQVRPWLVLKTAVSNDGAIAAGLAQRTAITGPESIRVVHRLRSAVDAVLVGANTVRIDNPRLNVRDTGDWTYESRNPLKVVLDPSLTLSGREKIFVQEPDRTVVFHRHDADLESRRRLEGLGATCEPVNVSQRGLDLASVMKRLVALDLHSVLLEPGKSLAESIIVEGLFDELYWFQAPRVFGVNSVAPDWDLLHKPLRRLLVQAEPAGAGWRPVGCDRLGIFPADP